MKKKKKISRILFLLLLLLSFNFFCCLLSSHNEIKNRIELIIIKKTKRIETNESALGTQTRHQMNRTLHVIQKLVRKFFSVKQIILGFTNIYFKLIIIF